MIDRKTDLELLRTALRRGRIVALLGPRQCGKTTLARRFAPVDSENYFDLEDPTSMGRLSEPNLALSPLKGLVIIDEIQRRPDLFPLLRVLADRRPLPARFLILGSAAPNLVSRSSETLAGRLEVVHLEGFASVTSAPAHKPDYGSAAGSPVPTLPVARPTRSSGAANSCRRSWSATFRSWACRFPRRP